MSIITLTTDYGLKDHFVGALKGKILSSCADATVIDISHDVDPFNIAEASYIINAAYSSFPAGTVHIIGVDAEKNKENQHITILWKGHYFICADNGILGLLSQRILPEKMVAINIHDRLLNNATDLDVFVTVACHISNGGALNVIGREISEIKTTTELQPVVSQDAKFIKGFVIYVDSFGNLVTNVTKSLFLEIAQGRPYEIDVTERRNSNAKKIKNIWPKYSDVATDEKYSLKDYEGQKLAIFNEAGFLEIAIFRSNASTVGTAASLLGLGYRDSITINFL